MASSRTWLLTPRSTELKIQSYRRVRKVWVPEPPSFIPLSSEQLSGFHRSALPVSTISLPEKPHPAQTVLLWPAHLSIAGPTRLPPIPRSEVTGAIAGELEPLLPWNIEDCQTAVRAIRHPQGWNAYAWATPRRWLENALEVLASCGLEPKYILPESLFLLLFRETDPAMPRSNEFLLAPARDRTLVMACQNGSPCRETIAEGDSNGKMSSFRSDLLLASVLMDTAEEAFLWQSPKPDDDKNGATGNRSDPEQLEEERCAGALARWTGKTGDTSLLPDFRNASLAFRKDREDLFRHFRNLGAVALVLLVLSLADAWLHVRALETRVEKTQSILTGLAEKILRPAPVVEPLSQLSTKKNELEKQERVLSRGADIIAILKDIAGGPDPGIPFAMISLAIGKKSVTLSGKTASFQDVEKIRSALLKTPHIRSLVVQSARLDIDRKTVAFRLGGTHD
ncbi:MAG: hypothetical protein M1297_09665 [Nitrospirae bacterium]|jgi:hypothetical protein|nr:hypothetical protein [Nitrospirota bacterium]